MVDLNLIKGDFNPKKKEDVDVKDEYLPFFMDLKEELKSEGIESAIFACKYENGARVMYIGEDIYRVLSLIPVINKVVTDDLDMGETD